MVTYLFTGLIWHVSYIIWSDLTGGTKAQYIYAIWKWGPLLSREWVSKTGDINTDASHDYKVQVGEMHSIVKIISFLGITFKIVHFFLFQYYFRFWSEVCYIMCRWSMVGPQNEIHYAPFALPQNGLPLRLYRKN